MSFEPAISVRDVGKCYTIYDHPQDRLKQSIMPRLRWLWGQQKKQYYHEFWALKSVSFEIQKGETVGILGRNGSGKSTLLQIVVGTVAPSSGTVSTKGRVAGLLELGSGFNPDFTGRENVFLNGALLGLTRGEIKSRFEAIAGFADIGSFMDQPIKTYSSGMVVRLAFAVMAHVDADILVIDEALAVGDAFFVQKCMRFLREFMKSGTILFVSHDPGAVINLCNRAILLGSGGVERIGIPKDVVGEYLASVYEADQGPHNVEKPKLLGKANSAAEERDMRLEFLNTSRHRNEIELFAFNAEGTQFGRGGASIISVVLADDAGMPLSWVVGGENVSLIVKVAARETLASPIVGFYVKDKLGQTLFGDNTYLTYRQGPPRVTQGQVLEGKFRFRMPVLPVGDYSVCVAVADGDQFEHIQHHWLHEAVMFRSHSSSVCTGLVGIPMRGIELSIDPETI